MERVQKIATKWFYGSHIEYRERLLKCNLLPVSMYYELHDMLYLDSAERKIQHRHQQIQIKNIS